MRLTLQYSSFPVYKYDKYLINVGITLRDHCQVTVRSPSIVQIIIKALSAMLFPCEAKELLESQPVAACKIGKVTETSEPILSATSCIGINRFLSLTPV